MPAQMPKLTEADLKKPSEWRIIGHDIQRPDVAMKVNGTAKFGIDTQIPGMLYASILRSPVLGNGPDKVDDAEAKKVKGVVAIIPLRLRRRRARHPHLADQGGQRAAEGHLEDRRQGRRL